MLDGNNGLVCEGPKPNRSPYDITRLMLDLTLPLLLLNLTYSPVIQAPFHPWNVLLWCLCISIRRTVYPGTPQSIEPASTLYRKPFTELMLTLHPTRSPSP